MANRLSTSTSPYLLQHAGNPVDWWPWSDQAFTEARRRDVPVLLSVGYAACHWCHVMAHDSFEDEGVAAVMNEHFVNIKVDREERPDVDAVYMEATTAMTGAGGWPMTCLLTPDGAPFFTGTFFPRDQFRRLLLAVAQAWREQRDEVVAAGQRVLHALGDATGTPSDAETPTAAQLRDAVQQLGTTFDEEHAGFGGAPKFPPSMVLEFLLRHHERTTEPDALRMVERTCAAMARGGIYDQLAGGFARYSVDEAWQVPHFEKMLYDNALLLRVYVHWWRVSHAPLAGRIAGETADFLTDELVTAEGGFASALDADTNGVEGLTYVWTPAQLRAVLGDEAEAAAELFRVTERGTFEHGASTLQLPQDAPDEAQWASIRARLRTARASRPQPARDDKVVTAWNGLTIAALAEAGIELRQPRFLAAAITAADLLCRLHLVDGRLRRSSRAGVVGAAAGVAEDYGDFAEGLLALHQATGDPRWLGVAGHLLDTAMAHFRGDDGGFFDTADDAERLVRRPKDPTDNATPSGQHALANALIGYAALTGSLDHRTAAEQVLGTVSALGARHPRFFGWGLAAAEALVSGPVEVAVVGESGAGPLTDAAREHRPPGAVVVSGDPDAPGVPLLAGRPIVSGAPAAYVCRGMVCDAPVTSVAELLSALRR
jgi:uncharacterized protein